MNQDIPRRRRPLLASRCRLHGRHGRGRVAPRIFDFPTNLSTAQMSMNDWIKVRTNLHEDARILKLADLCGKKTEHVVGMLVRFWSWAGSQTADGTGISVSKKHLDKLVNCRGFANALIAVGWLEGEDGNFQIPRFERHNGNNAKARALEAEAKRLRRLEQESDNCPTSDGQNVGHLPDNKPPSVSDTCRTLVGHIVGPEKRREEKNSTHSPLPRAREGSPEEGGRSREEQPPSGARRGFPTRKEVLDYAASRGWDLNAATRFYLHHDDKRSRGGIYPPEWHWWSLLEKWMMDDQRGLNDPPGMGARGRGARGSLERRTISRFDQPGTWTPDQMTF